MKKDTTEIDETNPYEIHYDNYLDTNASTECTGLMYRPSENFEEWERYHDVFNFYPGHKGGHDLEQNSPTQDSAIQDVSSRDTSALDSLMRETPIPESSSPKFPAPNSASED